MCLILLAHRAHPLYPLILAANRDEFFARPTEPLAYWPDEPEILAGRDLQAGGTWFGLSREGRFAAVTNFRDPHTISAEALSRGRIPVDYLKGGLSPQKFCEGLEEHRQQYNGFNLLAGDRESLVYASNRGGQTRLLSPGLYGLSNAQLDTGWPKVQRGKEGLRRLLADNEAIAPEDLFRLLQDRWQPPDDQLPDTGVDPIWERLLAPIFISGKDYGTRSSLVLTVGKNGKAVCCERTFSHSGGIACETGQRRVDLNLSPS